MGGVIVANINVKVDFKEHFPYFDVLIVDEAQRRLQSISSALKLPTRPSRVIILSGSLISKRDLPLVQDVFRFDKTLWVMQQTNMAWITISVVPIDFSPAELNQYLISIESDLATSMQPDFCVVVFMAFVAAAEKNETLRSAWSRVDQERWASLVLGSFTHVTRRLEDARTTLKNAHKRGLISKLELIAANHPHLGPLRNYLPARFRSTFDEVISSNITPSQKIEEKLYQKKAAYLDSSALRHAIPGDKEGAVVRNIMAVALREGKKCPRVLLRVSDVLKISAAIRDEWPWLLVLPLHTGMGSGQRERRIASFKSFDGARTKLKVLQRFAKTATGISGRVFRMCGGVVLHVLEAYLVVPRVLVCDSSAELGFNLHRHATSIFSTVFYCSFDECLQFCGRVCRLAPEVREPSAFHLSMPMYKGSLQDVLFFPAIMQRLNELRPRPVYQDEMVNPPKRQRLRKWSRIELQQRSEQ